MPTKPQTTQQRQARYRERQRALGRAQRTYWATREDHEEISALVRKLNDRRERE